MDYESVIGLEVHAQLSTESKLFCACPTAYGSEPNTQTCPVCLGMPGVLPVTNALASEYAVRMALAVGCTINPESVFARKNYFYPDLPKGYQISQFDRPLAEGGHMDIDVDGTTKRIGITRIHMEDDAGKLTHGEGGDSSSYVDLNRTGTPLIEIVSEPDMRTPEEASAYLKALRDILLYLGICDCNMQEGSLRCDANVSVRPVGQTKLGTKAELKNMNSFKFIRDALTYEIERQIELVKSGEAVIQETRLFDPSTGLTRAMRSKEEAHDYRYFPDPDLLPLIIPDEVIEEARTKMPELPAEKRARFESRYKLPLYDAGVLTASRELADFYEETVKAFPEPKVVSNWVMGEILRLLKDTSKDITESPVTPEKLAGLLGLVKDNVVSSKTAKEVFEEMFSTGKDAPAIVKEKGLEQVSDEGELGAAIDTIIKDNSESVERYRGGKTKLMGFFVGEVMKATKGKANPALATKLLKERLDK